MTPHIDVSASVDTSVLKIAIEHRLHWPLCMFITLGLCSSVINWHFILDFQQFIELRKAWI